jgi:predicted transcriptional regulator
MIRAAERRAKAVELRKEGRTFNEIAAALGVSRAAAHKMVSGAIDELNALTIDETRALRQQQLDRIGVLMAGLFAAARRGEVAKVNAAIKLMEREAKLAGLDAPSEFSGPGGGPIPVAAPTSRSPIIWIPPEDKNDDGRGAPPTSGG